MLTAIASQFFLIELSKRAVNHGRLVVFQPKLSFRRQCFMILPDMLKKGDSHIFIYAIEMHILCH